MKTVIEMAREVGAGEPESLYGRTDYVVMTKFELERFTELVRADKRETWPAQQEPVATLWQHSETGRTRITIPDDITDCDARWFKAADLYTSPLAQRKPLNLDELKALWNSQADHMNQWDELGIDEIVAFAQAAHNIKEQP